MRLPLASYGMGTALTAAAVLTALALGASFLIGPWALVALVLPAFVLYFFRDPERHTVDDAAAVVAPADGKVVAITDGRMPGTGGKAVLIDIFLSIFNVHINRAPLAGKVSEVIYKKGEFQNALRSGAGEANERNTVFIEVASGGTIAVRQISGAIARRIVCGVSPGDEVAHGARFGMIKFGSRTQLFVPEEMGFEASISVGDKVKAGETVLGRVN